MQRVRTILAGAAVAALAAAPAAGAAAKHKTTTYKGKTTQGQAIVVKYVKLSAHKGGLSVQTRVAGACPVQGFNQSAALSTNVGDHATGVYPIPNPVGWDHTGASYEIKFQSKIVGKKKIVGKIWVTWHTNVDNAPTCTSPVVTFSAKRE